MASEASPSSADDFILLDAGQIHHLPLRPRRSQYEAEHDSDGVSSDDDLEHVNTPDSVRSLDTQTSTPSPIALFETDSSSTPSSPTLQPSSTTSQHQNSPPRNNGTREDGAQSQKPSDSANVASPELPSATKCHTHVSFDQQIMDLLIEHVLTRRIEQEYGHGRSNDQRLRQQMMTRFRTLPANHSLVKDSLTRIDGSKVLFQGQLRSVMDIADIYHAVFTDVERMALIFLTGCHMLHFTTPCSFYGDFMPAGQDMLHRAMLHEGAAEGRSLAVSIQSTVFARLGMDPTFQDSFDDPRRSTKQPASGPAAINIAGAEAARAQRATTQQALQTTLVNLPYYNYFIDKPVEVPRLTSSTILKRESPEDDNEQNDTGSSPPAKRLQFDPRIPQHVGNAVPLRPTPSADKPSQMSKSETCDQSLCEMPLVLWNGPNHCWNVTEKCYNDTTRYALQYINTRVQALYDFDLTSRMSTKLGIEARRHGDLPYTMHLFLLEQQGMTRLAMCRSTKSQTKDEKSARHAHIPHVQEPNQDPYFEPVGQLRSVVRNLDRDSHDIALSAYGKIWMSEHASRCAAMASPTHKEEFVARMMQDREIVRHFSQHNLRAIDYVFSMDALLVLKCMQFAYSKGVLSAKESEATDPPPRSVLQDMQMQIMLFEKQRRAETVPQRPAPMQQRSAMQSMRVPQTSTTSRGPTYDALSRMQRQQLELQNEWRSSSVGRSHGEPAKEAHANQDADCQLVQRPGMAEDGESLTRGYRHDTLLASSLNRPTPPVLSMKNDPGTAVCGQVDSFTPIAPAKRVEHVAGESQARMDLAEETHGKGKDKGTTVVCPSGPDSSRGPTFLPDPNRKDRLSCIVEHDYQQQLLLLEQQNRKRLRLKKQTEQDRNVTGSDISKPKYTLNNGVLYISFEHWQSGAKIEYNIRADINSVNTSSLSTSFKDVNCLHVSCHGWKSTSERIRQAQKEHWKGVKARLNVAENSAKEEKEPEQVQRQKREENKIAWSLAELNPCLRSHATEDLLHTAVRHYINRPSDKYERSSKTPKTRARTMEWCDTPQIPAEFVVQTSDEIMNDPYLEESSSPSSSTLCEEDTDGFDEEENDDDGKTEPDLPQILIGRYGSHLLFKSGSDHNSSSTFYTVLAGVDKVLPFLEDGLRTFSQKNCICSKVCKTQIRKGSEHEADCQVGIALAYQNPELVGKEREEVRRDAVTNYRLLTETPQWWSTRWIKVKWPSPHEVHNWAVPVKIVDDAFILFRDGSGARPLKAQCSYCNQILDRSHLADRVLHMAGCEGYCRSKGVNPSIVTCGTRRLREIWDDSDAFRLLSAGR